MESARRLRARRAHCGRSARPSAARSPRSPPRASTPRDRAPSRTRSASLRAWPGSAPKSGPRRWPGHSPRRRSAAAARRSRRPGPFAHPLDRRCGMRPRARRARARYRTGGRCNWVRRRRSRETGSRPRPRSTDSRRL